jgi:hypothetical protein
VLTNQQHSIPPDATIATEGAKAAHEPPIDLLNDDPELHEPEFVDFAAYGKVIPAGLERPPRDIDETRLWTLTDDTGRFLNDRKSEAGYDEYLPIGCYAFFDSCANAAISEALDALSTGPPLLLEQATAVALITAGHRTHAATEEAARTRLGFLRLTKGGQTSSDSDRVFPELAHGRFCRPCPTAVSGPLDELRQSFVDMTIEVSMHAASKAADGAAFARATPDKPLGQDAKAKKAASDKRKVALVTTAKAAAGTKPSDGTKPSTKKCWCHPPRRLLLPVINYMRHRVRLKWREWEHIGASGQVVTWIRHGVRAKFKNGLRPKLFNHGVSMKDANHPQLDFLATKLPRFEACGAWERA